LSSSSLSKISYSSHPEVLLRNLVYNILKDGAMLTRLPMVTLASPFTLGNNLTWFLFLRTISPCMHAQWLVALNNRQLGDASLTTAEGEASPGDLVRVTLHGRKLKGIVLKETDTRTSHTFEILESIMLPVGSFGNACRCSRSIQ